MQSSLATRENPTASSSKPADEILVRVEGVGKKFCRDLKKSLWYGAQDVISELNPLRSSTNRSSDPGLRPGEFWANKDISFELRRGECLGLIGRNGAGKTTLLKMLNGLIKPDVGRIEMRGRVGAMIALGAGFNPILTGRENIYVSGSILGLSKQEIEAEIEGIIEFSEIREFIDSPVQSYSSGMQVRLGFAVASNLKPDILILDEVLAVGDFRFRQKCLEKIQSVIAEAAVIFVSHQDEQIRKISSKALMLSHGRVKSKGLVSDVFQVYNSEPVGNILDDSSTVWAASGIKLTSMRFEPEIIETGDPIQFACYFSLEAGYDQVAVRLVIRNSSSQILAEYNDSYHGIIRKLSSSDRSLVVNIPRIQLLPAKYSVDVFLFDVANGRPLISGARGATICVKGSSSGIYPVQM